MMWPCATSNDSLVWCLWHSLMWRRGALIPKGIALGLIWANCPSCDGTFCKEVKHGY